MVPESKEELAKRVALQLQIALTAWHELYPDDSDADACSKSLDLVEFEIEDLLTRPDPAPSMAPSHEASNVSSGLSDEELERRVRPQTPAPKPTEPALTEREEFEPLVRRRPREDRQQVPFRQMLIEIGREYPGGLDISTIIEEAQTRGWSHPNPRNYVSITASQLVRSGLLVRRDRGTYALSPAFMGIGDSEDAPES